MKRKLAAIALSATLALGGMTVVAAPASASVNSNCYNMWNGPHLRGYAFYVNYNILEKALGYRNHWVHRYYEGRSCPWPM